MKIKHLATFVAMTTVASTLIPYANPAFAAEQPLTTLQQIQSVSHMAPKSEQITVQFQVDGVVTSTFEKTFSDMIAKSELPENPQKDGYDFLGWYWGPKGQETKYEGVFPLDLSKIPNTVRNQMGTELVFTARFGHHTPANPREKKGYRLIFEENFDDAALDETKWVDRYLSSWSTTASETQKRTITDGTMHLEITEDTKPWCPEFDGQTVISGFSTGQRNGLHNWNGNNVVRNPEDTKLTHINQYGYYEMRAKGQSGSSRHSAWWLIGFEDVPEESVEIDIFEVLGRDNHTVPPAIHSWNDKDAFSNKGLQTYTNTKKDFNNEYHVYGFDWQQGTSNDPKYPDKIVFYVDGEKYAEKNVNIDYPLIQLISLYEKRAGGWTGDWEWMPYPNTFDIDYIRVYKKLPAGQPALSEDALRVTQVHAEDLSIPQDQIALKTYQTEKGTYTEKNLAGTKSYVRVDWNDGIETQEPVFWEPITQADLEQLKSGQEVVKNGTIPSIEQSTTMTIHPVIVPYTAEGLVGKTNNALDLLFDGKMDNQSGEFVADQNTLQKMKEEQVFITYDFQKEVALKGIDFYTNFGKSQGILSAKLQAWDEQTQQWKDIPVGNQDAVFTVDWKTEQEEIEKQSVTFSEVSTSKVRLYILKVGNRWANKFAMREIAFQI